jgi:hypothetical protein
VSFVVKKVKYKIVGKVHRDNPHGCDSFKSVVLTAEYFQPVYLDYIVHHRMIEYYTFKLNSD